MYKLFLLFILLNTVYSAPAKNSTNGDVAPCLAEFFSIVYNGDYNCTNDFDYFSNDTTTLRKAFTSGKSCFLEVAKQECAEGQYTLLSAKYDDFLNVLTTPPQDSEDCSSFYFKYNSLKCTPMFDDFTRKAAPLVNVVTKINDSRVVELIDICHQVQVCTRPTCYFSEAEKAVIDNGCEMIELKNTEFTVCLSKIQKQKPDMSEYTCLDGLDYYDSSVDVAIEKLTTKRACVKEILEDICGEKAVENFEEHADFMLKTAVRMKGMTGLFSNENKNVQE